MDGRKAPAIGAPSAAPPLPPRSFCDRTNALPLPQVMVLSKQLDERPLVEWTLMRAISGICLPWVRGPRAAPRHFRHSKACWPADRFHCCCLMMAVRQGSLMM